MELSNYKVSISGIITVGVIGRTQLEKRYILETVLDHLPGIYGFFGNEMKTHVIKKNGATNHSWENEFGQYIGKSCFMQDFYMIVIEGQHRDMVCTIDEAHKNFQKWIRRLARRLYVEDVLVKLTQYYNELIEKEILVTNENNQYKNMFEKYSWVDSKSKNWSEYLLWNHNKYEMPDMLKQYYKNESKRYV